MGFVADLRGQGVARIFVEHKNKETIENMLGGKYKFPLQEYNPECSSHNNKDV